MSLVICHNFIQFSSNALGFVFLLFLFHFIQSLLSANNYLKEYLVVYKKKIYRPNEVRVPPQHQRPIFSSVSKVTTGPNAQLDQLPPWVFVGNYTRITLVWSFLYKERCGRTAILLMYQVDRVWGPQTILYARNSHSLGQALLSRQLQKLYLL